MRQLGYNGSESTKAWGFEASKEPMKITGRVLDPPGLMVRGANNKEMTLRAGAGTIDMRGKRFLKPASIARWGLVVFADEGGRFGISLGDAQNAVTGLVKAMSDMGMVITNKTPPILFVGERNQDVRFSLVWVGEC